MNLLYDLEKVYDSNKDKIGETKRNKKKSM